MSAPILNASVVAERICCVLTMPLRGRYPWFASLHASGPSAKIILVSALDGSRVKTRAHAALVGGSGGDERVGGIRYPLEAGYVRHRFGASREVGETTEVGDALGGYAGHSGESGERGHARHTCSEENEKVDHGWER